jgi:hypothetical protein
LTSHKGDDNRLFHIFLQASGVAESIAVALNNTSDVEEKTEVRHYVNCENLAQYFDGRF